MTVESIILDIDGTLWNTLEVVKDGWNGQMIQEGHGQYALTIEDLQNLFGRTTEDIADRCFPGLPQQERYALMERCMAREHRMLYATQLDLTYPGTVATLRALAKKFRLFIVSNSEAGYPQLLLKKLGIGDIITEALCYGDTGRPKGENIRTLMQRNGVTRALYVGDTQGDCDASTVAGVPFVWAAYGFGKVSRYDAKIDSITQLLQLCQPALVLPKQRKAALDQGFAEAFGGVPQAYFSAPGRTEIGGNHTDHQRGRVLAAAVDLDTQAAVRINGTSFINIQSKGYPLSRVDLGQLTPQPEEINTTAALIRGVAARFAQLGCRVQGFDAYVESTVLPGSGLSSSAAFEVLVGTIINDLFFAGQVSQPEIAAIGQYAENVFFGTPCGLMDQMASSVGGLVTIDFFDRENPEIRSVSYDFAESGHALCIIDTRASHADLTDEYAAIPNELKDICTHFGCEVLTQIPEESFYAQLPVLREKCGDRAVLRAIHFYQENARVPRQVEALERGDFDGFLRLLTESGHSSYMYLQNVIPAGYTRHQDVALGLALCQHLLAGRGGYRVHGGGFAGTVQAFVPVDMLDVFRTGIDAVLGQGACHVLSVRPQGGARLCPQAE